MNIMITADYRTHNSGNFIPSLLALARRVKENGDSVVFVFPARRPWADWLESEGFRVVTVTEDELAPQNQVRVLSALLKQYRIDLLHIHFGLFHYAAVRHKKELGSVKVLIHDHMDFGVSQTAKQFIRTVLLSGYYAWNHINLISVMKRKTKSYWFLKNKWYIPNGLSMERNISHPMTREECRESLGVTDGDIVCLLLGWDYKRKGLDIALRAIRECRKQNPSVLLGIIGAGQGEVNDRAKAFIEAETDIPWDAPWIRYFNNYEDMFAVYRSVDVYISASRREAFSYGLLESISQDTPVVSSDVAGVSWAKPYTNGHFYPTEDVSACTEAILDAIKAGRIPTNSEEFLKEYGIDRWCDRVTDVYRKIMK